MMILIFGIFFIKSKIVKHKCNGIYYETSAQSFGTGATTQRVSLCLRECPKILRTCSIRYFLHVCIYYSSLISK